jgi:hypothetical protein
MSTERCYPVHSVALVGLIHMGDIKSRAHARANICRATGAFNNRQRGQLRLPPAPVRARGKESRAI